MYNNNKLNGYGFRQSIILQKKLHTRTKICPVSGKICPVS
jgi:hypothetical protein